MKAIALLICAVVVLVAAVPLALADTHLITKGPKGPRQSAVTWEYRTGTVFGVWTGEIENNGLRWLVVDVYDNTTGVSDQIFHQRIRFAAYDAYPTGIVETEPVLMGANRVYEVTVTPNGPTGSSCIVTDKFVEASPPVASFTVQVDGATVYVDGSASYDPDGTVVEYTWDFGDGTLATGATATHTYEIGGTYTITLTVLDNDGLWSSTSQEVYVVALMPPVASFTYMIDGPTIHVDASASSDSDGTIMSYDWDFGDGSTASGVTASHSYAMGGTYLVVLVVTDNDGLTGSAEVSVELPDSPPVASFTIVVDGSMVYVDASGSSDDFGIVSYAWDWGDGTTSTGVTASHDYSASLTSSSTSSSVETMSGDGRQAPPPPYPVFGFIYDAVGVEVPNATVTVTDTRTGQYLMTVSDQYGYYTVDLNTIPQGWVVGDLINVTAVKDEMIGWNESVIPDPAGSYLWIDVHLTGPVQVTITLTVTDTMGQISMVTQTVTIYL
jgi:PKD repeat protein